VSSDGVLEMITLHTNDSLHHWSVAVLIKSWSRLHQTWISRCFSSTLWMSVWKTRHEWSSISDSPLWVV